jgi:sugar phosphate isomerase/epimerase
MMTEYKPAEQQEILKKSGYSGVALVVNNEGDLPALDDHIKAPLTSKDDFKITAVLTALEITADSIKPGTVFLEKLFSRLEKTKTIFWPIISKGTTDKRVSEAFSEIAELAARYHVPVVLYPHDQTYMETAIHALKLIKMTGRKDLMLSFHLCHELRAGNGPTIGKAIREVAPYIALASISGANNEMQADSVAGWDDAIKPLYSGSYNTQNFLDELVKSGYKGPVVLHTFDIKEKPFDKFLLRSSRIYSEMLEKSLK